MMMWWLQGGFQVPISVIFPCCGLGKLGEKGKRGEKGGKGEKWRNRRKKRKKKREERLYSYNPLPV